MKKSLLYMLILLLFAPAALAQDSKAPSTSGHDSGAHRERLEEYRRYIESLPDSQEKEKAMGRYYFELGKVMISEGRYEEALSLFEEGELYIDDMAALSYHRGLVYFELKRYYEAEAELFDIAFEGEGNAKALKLMGEIYYGRGDLDLAIDAWAQALLLLPNDHELARLLEKAKREVVVEGDFDRVYSGRFLLQYGEERDESIGKIILDILEEAYTDVGADLEHYPEVDIPVIVYTRKEFKSVTQKPDWVGGVYDGKIRVPVGGLGKESIELKRLLYHEYTHAVIYSLAAGGIPRWLHEGLAAYEESRFAGYNVGSLKRAAGEKSLLSLDDMDKAFVSSDGKKALLAYEQSYSFISFIIDNYGLFNIVELLQGLSEGESSDDAVKRICGGTCGGIKDLFMEWKAMITSG